MTASRIIRIELSPRGDLNTVAMNRFAAIAPMLEFRALLSAGSKPVVVVSGKQFTSLRSLIAWRAEQSKVSSSSLWSWLRKFVAAGFSGLVPRGRSDRGKSRFFSAHPDLRTFALQLCTEKGLTARAIHRAMVKRFPSSHPSYATVCHFLKSLNGRSGR